jgi:hypothetical protein
VTWQSPPYEKQRPDNRVTITAVSLPIWIWTLSFCDSLWEWSTHRLNVLFFLFVPASIHTAPHESRMLLFVSLLNSRSSIYLDIKRTKKIKAEWCSLPLACTPPPFGQACALEFLKQISLKTKSHCHCAPHTLSTLHV